MFNLQKTYYSSWAAGMCFLETGYKLMDRKKWTSHVLFLRISSNPCYSKRPIFLLKSTYLTSVGWGYFSIFTDTNIPPGSHDSSKYTLCITVFTANISTLPLRHSYWNEPFKLYYILLNIIVPFQKKGKANLH